MLVFRHALSRRATLTEEENEHDHDHYTASETQDIVETQMELWASHLSNGLAPGLETAIASNSISALLNAHLWAVAWDAVDAKWNGAVKELLISTGQKEIDRLKFGFSLTQDNRYATAWAKQNSATRVTQITAETQKAIRSCVGEAFKSKVPPRELTKIIRPVIGLTDRQAQLVVDRGLQRLADGVSTEKVRKETERYAARLLRQRSTLIARTETVDSQNKGLQASWQTARDQGHLTRQTKRVWLAAIGSERTCDVCSDFGAPGNRETGLDEPYHSTSHGDSHGPTCHPGCRCGQGLRTRVDKS